MSNLFFLNISFAFKCFTDWFFYVCGREVGVMFYHSLVHHQFSSSLSPVRLFAATWTAAHKASLSISNSQSLIKLKFIKSVMPSDHPILCCPLLLPPSVFPSIRVFSNESGGQNIGASSSALPMNIQDWVPLGLTGWISLPSKVFSRVSSNTTVQKHQFFSAQLSLWTKSHIHTWLLDKP